jgi:epoxyqueuosine reductase
MDKSVDEVFARLRERGYQARMISVEHLPLLQKQIEEQRSQKLLDSQFFEERLSWVQFQIPESLPKAQSVIVVAVPRPQTRAVFTSNGVRRPLILPPTYTAYDSIKKQVQDLLAQLLSEKGYTVTGTELPLKLLAARSGLAQYGRNNIGYASGMGSFLQIVAYYSDMPCEEDSWQEPAMLQACENCDLCRRACPTGAIPSDRFLLRAELCITYHNEKKGDIPFPSWMDASWHNCIEGCMRCQRACPVDRQFLDWAEDEEEFSEEETAMLLEGTSREKLPEEAVRKLMHLDLLNDIGILPRNLGVFFKKQG